jgi:hypothetical protein
VKVPQPRIWGWPAAIAQAGLAGVWEAIDQLIPLPVGRVSVRVVPVEPPEPVLDREIVKPMGEPALTGAVWSAVLAIERVEQFTVSEAWFEEPEPPLPLTKDALFA